MEAQQSQPVKTASYNTEKPSTFHTPTGLKSSMLKSGMHSVNSSIVGKTKDSQKQTQPNLRLLDNDDDVEVSDSGERVFDPNYISFRPIRYAHNNYRNTVSKLGSTPTTLPYP